MSPRQAKSETAPRHIPIRRRGVKAATTETAEAAETAGTQTAPPPQPRASPRASPISAPDLSGTPPEKISLAGLDPRTLISPNFRAYELTKSDLALRRGIANGFTSDDHLRAAINLARNVLQPIRDKFGSFTPNSVYRSQALERALKNKPATWQSTSQHARGEACDIEIVGMATLALAAWARDHLSAFDQIICECYDPRQGPNSGWVHISLKAPGQGTNRHQCLSYVTDASGRLVYVSGLQPTA